jgi:regulator of replication initiation timing
LTSVGSYYYNQPRVDEVSMIAIMRVGKKEIFMQKLNILEQKIADLIERIKELRADVAQKAGENSALKEQLKKRVEEQLSLQD